MPLSFARLGAPLIRAKARLYELRLRQLLHDKLELRVETIYEAITRLKLAEPIPTVVKYDVHSFDVYKNYLSLGFFPLSTNERMNVGLLDLAAWGFLYQNKVTKVEYSKHYAEDLKAAIFEMGRHETSIYLGQVFDSNPKLSADDKENVQDLFPNNQAGINRVILYMNGIIRKKGSS